jgi:hypothetical protein
MLQGPATSEDYDYPFFSQDIFQYVALTIVYLCRHIEEVDLLRFFSKEEAALVLPMFEGASETGKIKKKSLKTWVVMKISNAITIFLYNMHPPFLNTFYYYLNAICFLA